MNLAACDNVCPQTDSDESWYYQNLGCLPWKVDIKTMLENKQVWMCHSNSEKPCVATGLKEVPEGYEAITEY